MKNRKQKIYSILLTAAIFTSCEKYLSVDPPNDKLATSSVFADSTSTSSAITGMYSEMMIGNLGFVACQMRWAGLSADELNFSSSSDVILQFQNSNLLTDNTNLNSLWVDYYKYIYRANNIIEGIGKSQGISVSAKKTLEGEARFVRAFLFFYLVNNWGDVPLTLTTDYHENESMPRASAAEIYEQIITDLQQAIQYLPSTYLTEEKVRPNKLVAMALLARIQLYQENWSEAETLATAVIESGEYLPLPALSDIFLKDSKETIWQLYPATLFATDNTWDGSLFVPASLTNATIPTYVLPIDLYNSFESTDQRKLSWIGVKTEGPYYFPYKYKVRSSSQKLEYPIVLRVAEQLLIRAEARAEQNNLQDALGDLNIIRKRAQLEDLSVNLTKTEVLVAVENERRHELFCEWGHRWLDLKRTGRADAVLTGLKGSNWQSTDALWPVPLNQLLTNPNLIQNNSY